MNFVTNMSVPERLVALRTHKGWTQKDLTNKLFVSTSSIKRWETGKALPLPHMRKAIAVLYETAEGDIFPLELIQSEKTKGG